jgi:3D (Asp-Asp-Asp) domain-containing protein
LFVGLLASRVGDGFINAEGLDASPSAAIINDCFVTGYYCVYDSELGGTQTVKRKISDNKYTLKASFLFGGLGIAMQGTGKTGPNGDYIKYTGGGGCFVRISGPRAGRNLQGRWVISPRILRSRYACLGITDFTGFGNLALARPGRASYTRNSSVAGSTGQALSSWYSIAADPSLLPPGKICTLVFKKGATMPHGDISANFKAEDTGGAIKGRHIDIYLGEGRAAWGKWLQTGGDRYVDIYLDPAPKISARSTTSDSS